MKPIAFEYQITRDEWLTGLIVVLARYSANEPYRPLMNIARLVGLLILYAVWAIAGWNPWSLLAAGMLLPLGEALIQRTIGRKSIGSTFDSGQADIRLEVSDDGLHERTRDRERRFLWSGVRAIYKSGDAVVFDLVGTGFIVIPFRVLDETKWAQLEAGAAEFERPIQGRAQSDARAGIRLSEVVVIAKVAVAVAIMGVVVDAATSDRFVLSLDPAHRMRFMLFGLAVGLVAAVAGWFASGALLRFIARRRGESAANLAAWALIIINFIVFFAEFGRV